MAKARINQSSIDLKQLLPATRGERERRHVNYDKKLME
jgi:hypothetical protein